LIRDFLIILIKRGLLLKSSKEYKEACKLFTECLETGKIYSPEIRKGCLENLKEILTEQNLIHKAPNILKILEHYNKRKNNDIVFLLDSSESMGTEARKDYAIREILKVIKNF
jgi:hypothetical protein